MKSAVKQASVVQTIDSFLAQVAASGRNKAAEAQSEAGGYQGGTTHPVKNIDDRLSDATEGSRSAENSSDVKEQQGSISVDSTSDTINQGQDEAQLNLGTQQSATGEDSSVETSSAKGGKEDASDGDQGSQGRGKTTHPARTDNTELEGGKYASASNVLGHIKEAEDLGTKLIARLAVEAQGQIAQKAASLAGNKEACGPECGKGKPAAKKPIPSQKVAAAEAASAGYDLAALLTADAAPAEKQAAYDAVVNSIAHTIQDARNLADQTAPYCDRFFASLNKAAEDEPPPSDEDEGKGEEGGSGEPQTEGDVPGAEDAAGAMGPDGGGDDESALIEQLLGGAGGGDMGGGDMGGGDMGGGMPPGAGGAGGEGVPDLSQLSPEDLQMLQQILQQLQSSPDQLEAAATAKAAAALKQQRQKAAGSQAGWQPKTAAQAQRYQAMFKYVTELLR